MGVKHFFVWFRKNFAGNIKTISRSHSENAGIDVDILAIDMNGIIHNCAQRVFRYGNYAPRFKKLLVRTNKTKQFNLEKKVYEAVANEVNFFRKFVNPKKKLLLCVDGVAGLSKMNQQRQRRFKSAKENHGLVFDSNAITPGTQFLDRLTKYLDWYIQMQISVSPEWQSLEVILSNEKVCGEGEHKIINYLRKYKQNGESCCIHGMDADLIMLSMSAPCKNMFVLREDSFRRDAIHMIDIRAFS